jgi:hypothetical protein
MPFMSGGRRDYKRELNWEKKKKPERVKQRAQRNKARSMMAKKVGKSALKGKDVGHRTALSKGGLSSMFNIMVQNQGENRSFSRKSDGSMKSETSKRERRK